ncbi:MULTISPECIES: hypothetical protein [Mesoflavibacter]|uniref:hypothetical protein n=1 Tax=Mesoflavibacter TaxID=444051 RepID=UPI00243A90A0|nr:hypothetical protein [Mesoflavibacter zeaxanthinifaciens]MCP4054695.1 hypothetical protein [Mesoflavibacter sp.]|tara:strand:- start:377 stop:637 length:261 start_codon:yes stop_codon:yes gene_type:complete
MKQSIIYIIFCSFILIVLSSCSDDPCDVAHTIIDGECIPDYIFPDNQNLKSGDQFYHNQYGVITYKEGLWFDNKGILIAELNIKKQ